MVGDVSGDFSQSVGAILRNVAFVGYCQYGSVLTIQHCYAIVSMRVQKESGKTQTVKRDRSVCAQLMLYILDLLRLSRDVGEASSGKLPVSGAHIA